MPELLPQLGHVTLVGGYRGAVVQFGDQLLHLGQDALQFQAQRLSCLGAAQVLQGAGGRAHAHQVRQAGLDGGGPAVEAVDETEELVAALHGPYQSRRGAEPGLGVRPGQRPCPGPGPRPRGGREVRPGAGRLLGAVQAGHGQARPLVPAPAEGHVGPGQGGQRHEQLVGGIGPGAGGYGWTRGWELDRAPGELVQQGDHLAHCGLAPGGNEQCALACRFPVDRYVAEQQGQAGRRRLYDR